MSLDEIWETSMYVRCRLIGSIENGKGGYPENDIQCLLLNGLIIINVSTRALEAYSPILMHVWFFPLLFLMLPVLCLLIFLWWRSCETLPFRSSFRWPTKTFAIWIRVIAVEQQRLNRRRKKLETSITATYRLESINWSDDKQTIVK